VNPRSLFIAGFFLVARLTLLGQATGTTTGDIRGRILEKSGVPVPGVTVIATGQDMGLTRSDVSLADGSYALRLLPPGLYQLAASLTGFQSIEIPDVRVTVGSSTSVDLHMQLSRVTETMTVRAVPDLIDPTSTDVSQTIGERKIQNLPINQRNFLEFALTTPGVTSDRGPRTGAGATSGLSINGQSARYNNVLVDGLDNNDSSVGSVRATFSQEAVQEYQVIQSSFAAEYGRTAGGIVNVVTRSGSNDFHGSGFFFFRDESLAADNKLTGTTTPFEQLQYGASVGGPVLKDRLFFFGAAERLDVSDASVVTIPENAVAAIRANGFDVQNGAVPFSRSGDTFLLRLDLLTNASNTFALRGTYAKEEDENQQPWGGLVARTNGGAREIRDTALALTGTSILSAGISNELRLLAADRKHRLISLDPTGGPSVTILGVATFGTHRTLPHPRDTQIYQAFEAVSYFRGPSSYKLGVDFSHTDFQGALRLNFPGLYRFGALPPGIPGLPAGGLTALQAFEAGIPQVFVQGFGDPAVEGSTNQLGAFAQGEWIAWNRLLVRAGLRYDSEDPIAPFPTDSDNWAPRLSFSWEGASTWRIRGGAGRFYGVASIAPMVVVTAGDGIHINTVVQTILGGPSPATVWRLPDHRYASAAQAGGSAVPPTVLRPAGCEDAVSPDLNLTSCARFESAHTDQANLGFEMELWGRLVFQLDYLHARGRDIFVSRNINPLINGGSRPNPAFSDIFVFESRGNSWYDGITAGLRTRFGAPLEMSAYYTYADAEDDFIDWVTDVQIQDPLNPKGDRGSSIHVPRHKATVSAIYTTSGSKLSAWTRDWTFGLIAAYLDGRPFNVLAGFDRNTNGDPLSDRPPGVERNSGRLGAFFGVDLRIARRIPIGRTALEAIFEVFNVLNRKNVLEVNNVQFADAQLTPNPDFGSPTVVADPRRIQLGVRATF
jgi:hypothetical protein